MQLLKVHWPELIYYDSSKYITLKYYLKFLQLETCRNLSFHLTYLLVKWTRKIYTGWKEIHTINFNNFNINLTSNGIKLRKMIKLLYHIGRKYLGCTIASWIATVSHHVLKFLYIIFQSFLILEQNNINSARLSSPFFVMAYPDFTLS